MGADLNPALHDIKEIAENRPELTPEEWAVVDKASPWLNAVLRPEVRKELEVEYSKREKEFNETLRAETQELVKTNMEEWRKNQEPLSQADISTLLNQEYVEFQLKLKLRSGEIKERSFIICELPQESESKFIKVIQEHFVPLIQQLSAAEWTLDGTILEKITSILSNIPRALLFASEIAAISLDPWGEDSTIDPQWVRKNISTARIAGIVLAQVEANKYRDFFSNGSRLFRSLKTR